MEKYYTPEEAGEILSLSPNTIREWLRRGKVKGVKLSRKAWRIKESEIKRLLQENNQEE